MTPNKQSKLLSAGSFDIKQLVDSRAIQAQLSTAFLVNPSISEQLTTTQGGASHQPTTSPSPDLGSPQGASGGAGGASTVTVTAAASAGLTKTEVVTFTTTICDCSSDAPASPVSTGSSLPVTFATPTLSTLQVQPSLAGPNLGTTAATNTLIAS